MDIYKRGGFRWIPQTPNTQFQFFLFISFLISTLVILFFSVCVALFPFSDHFLMQMDDGECDALHKKWGV